MNLQEYYQYLYTYFDRNYPPGLMRDLCARFSITYDKKALPEKALMINDLLNLIKGENRLHALFCVMVQFKKYKRGNYQGIIEAGRPFTLIPGEIRRPRVHLAASGCEPQSEFAFEADSPSGEISAAVLPVKSHMKAMIIGVNQNVFGRREDNYCVEDAEAVYAFLHESCGLDPADIVLLTGYVSAREARKKLKELCAAATEEDYLLFYFAGYGMELCGKGYLMTSDSYVHFTSVRNALPLVSVNEILRASKARLKIRLFDANFSGQHLDELVKPNLQTQPPISQVELLQDDPLPDPIMKQVLKSNSGWITFTACDAHQYSCECLELGHSFFTYYLLEGLAGGKARRRHHPFSIEDLKIYVCNRILERINAEQIHQQPQYQCELSGNFLLEKGGICYEYK